MGNLLIKYIYREDNHVDPNFTYLTYGDSDKTKVGLIQNCVEPGSYVFFHTSYNNKAYITAYFYVERVLTKERHQPEIHCLRTDSSVDEVVILGSRERSKILTYPLPFDKNAVDNLESLNIDWSKVENGEQTELQTISNSTRMHRQLRDQEVQWLLNVCRNRG